MTLIYDLDLDMYLLTKNYICRSRLSKVRTPTGQRDIQTHRHKQTHYHVAFAGGKISASKANLF